MRSLCVQGIGISMIQSSNKTVLLYQGADMKNLRDTFRDMTPDEKRKASREAEIPRHGSIARAMLDAWAKGEC